MRVFRKGDTARERENEMGEVEGWREGRGGKREEGETQLATKNNEYEPERDIFFKKKNERRGRLQIMTIKGLCILLCFSSRIGGRGEVTRTRNTANRSCTASSTRLAKHSWAQPHTTTHSHPPWTHTLDASAGI